MAFDADGHDRQRITNDRWFSVDPMLSPDGRYLVYSSYRGEGHPAGLEPGQSLAANANLSALHVHLDQWQLILEDLQTRDEKAITRGRNCLEQGWWDPCEAFEGPAWVPVWLPDGTHIAYISARSGIDSGLYVVNADGSEAHPVFESRELVLNWHDWSAANQGNGPVLPSLRPPVPPPSLLYGGVAHELDPSTGADMPTNEILVASPDLWSAKRLQPLDQSGQALEPTVARWTPDRKHILFSAPVTTAQLNQIFIMDDDGTHVQQLTQPTTEDSLEPLPDGDLRSNTDPDMSPDGRYIIFTNSPANGQSSLLRMDTSSGEVVNLTSMTSGNAPGADLRARFSPDGKQIAFASLAETTQVFLISSDGQEFRRITDDSTEDLDPAWSPDGKWLVFVRHRSGIDAPGGDMASTGESQDSLVKVNLDSGVQVELARTSGQISRPAWTPNGERVVCIEVPPVDIPDAFVQPDIYQVSAEGGELQPIAVTLRMSEAFADVR
jgi:Tol biopolymer transport system component